MTTPQKVGVLLLDPAVQLPHASCVGLLAMLSPSYLRMCNNPAPIADQGRDFDFLNISEAGPKHPFPMTGGLSCNPTHDFTTCPPLDILVVPGPPPAYRPSKDEARFLHARLKSVEGMLCVCTAIFTFLQAGLLENLTVTALKTLLPMLATRGKSTK